MTPKAAGCGCRKPLDQNQPKSRRCRQRRGRGTAKTDETPRRSLTYRQLRHGFAPQAIFSEDEIATIHDTALRVLEELGMKILLPEAREIFAKGGARIDGEMVYIGRDIVEAAIASAPSSFVLRAANPAREQVYESGAMIFMAGAGCPNASDAKRGRRPGDLEAYTECIKLAQSFDVIHLLGPSVEPQDVPIHLRHYEMMRAQMEFSDKPICIYARGRGQITESLEMIQLGLGLSDEDFNNGVWGWTNINSNSPRMLDNPMAQGIIDMARLGQMSIITPFCLAGAMAPITVAGALTLQHAEALCGIALAQLTREGAAVSYGGFSSNVDMKSGSPAFGTPEHVKMELGAGQLARFIDLPWRSAAGSASNTSDMQAATENTMGVWGAALANATLTIHAAGWLEGGLSFGYEKLINDIEALQMLAEMTQKPGADAAEIGFDALKDVEPGGHFFATQHTMDRYRTAFYKPLVADLGNFGTWEDSGGKTSSERAVDIWSSKLENFEAPPGVEDVSERLATYIEARINSGGAPPLD